MKEHLTALYALQQLDTAIDLIKKQIAALDPGRAERAVYQAAKQAHAEALARLHSIQASVLDAELERKSIEAKNAEEEKRLYSGSVRAPKELQAMQDEIAMFGRQIARLDERIQTETSEREAATKAEADAKRKLRAATAALKARQEAYKEAGETLGNRGRELTAQRKAAAAGITPAFLESYEKIRALKGGVAVAALIEDGICDGCRMKIPNAQKVQVNEGNQTILCDNCRRILIPGVKDRG